MSRHARVVNADPVTGRPAILGEVASRQTDLETFGQPYGRLKTTPLADALREPEEVERLASAIPRYLGPVECLLQQAAQEWAVLDTRPLTLQPEAKLTYYHARWKAGAMSDLDFLAAVPVELARAGRVRLARRPGDGLTPFTRGIGISGEARNGILTSEADALTPCSRRGPYVVVVDRVDARHTPLLADPACQGILAVRGSRADHFALLTRERGFGYLALPNHRLGPAGLERDGATLHFGAEVTIDFVAGDVYQGLGGIVLDDQGLWTEAVAPLLARYPGPVAVRINVDLAEDLPSSLPPDAAGIGLVRTEHTLARRGIGELVSRVLDPGDDGGAVSVREIAVTLEPEIRELLASAAGRPVAVRLLDYPRHELPGASSNEVNPMLGLRGVRQGIYAPALYLAQIEALLRAAASAGVDSPLEIMLPLVAFEEEVKLIARWVEECRRKVGVPSELRVRVGAMVETPAALAIADRLARACDFLSFGTNDLTQLFLGLSREDYVAFLAPYRRQGVLRSDPFEELHPTVKHAIEDAARRARQANPTIFLGLCGDHARTTSALELVHAGLLDYVSVVPSDLPSARLRALSLLPAP